MPKSTKPKLSRKGRADFERSIQLQIEEYAARYYPGGRDVAAAVWAEKFPPEGNVSSEQHEE